MDKVRSYRIEEQSEEEELADQMTRQMMDLRADEAKSVPAILTPSENVEHLAPKVTVITDHQEVVMAIVEWDIGAGLTTAIGSAKRHPKDDFDWQIGASLALSRAFGAARTGFREHASVRGMVLGLGNVVKE